MINLVTVRSNTTGDDMDVIVVCVMMTIDQQWLTFVIISHLMKILVTDVQQFIKGVLTLFAGNRHMELRLLDVRVSMGVVLQVLLQVGSGYLIRHL